MVCKFMLEWTNYRYRIGDTAIAVDSSFDTSPDYTRDFIEVASGVISQSQFEIGLFHLADVSSEQG